MIKKSIIAKMRVIKERNKLYNKLVKLDEYLKREDIKQKDLLKRQQMIMLRYLIVLNERLDNWEE